jgi:SAM-dependent methyltransferase
MNSKNLSEYSEAYYSQANIYEIFSKAEDADNKIFKYLLPQLKGKTVLDAGCGTGKYLELFAPQVKQITGVDASTSQLELAHQKTSQFSNVKIIQGDLANINFGLEKFDIVLCTWVLGTILDDDKRFEVIKNLKTSLLENGKFILVENDCGGEFEEIRGRVNDPLNRTENYNNWLAQKAGFKEVSKIDCHFCFDSIQSAQKIFSEIWGDHTVRLINSPQINHGIIILNQQVAQ